MNTCLPKILITGADGQLGMALRHHPMAASFQLFSCSRAGLDISDEHAVNSLLKELKPDAVINAAAYTAVDKAESDAKRCLQVNHLGAQTLATACEQLALPFIHLSTDYVFAGNQSVPYTETDAVSPINVYGESKVLGEEAIRQHCEKHIILRVSGIFSAYGHNFMKTMRHLAKDRETLRVVSDQITCPTYAGDIAGTLFTLLTRLSHWGTYHYCNAPATSWHQFASAIIEEAGRHETLRVKSIIPIPARDYPTPARRPAYSVLDCSQILRDYGIQQTHWEAGIKEVFSS